MRYVTKKGYEQLKRELDELKNVKKWEIAEWLREASSQGDLVENAEYVEAKEAQTVLETRIEELERQLREAKVIKRRKKDVVDLGAKVEYTATNPTNKKEKIMLVGSEEADISQGKISVASPLGKSLLGRKPGDEVEVMTPKGKKKYKITKIS